MSISISILSRPNSVNRAAKLRRGFAVALPIRLGKKLTGLQQRRAARQMALAVEQLGHPGVIADFQRATRS